MSIKKFADIAGERALNVMIGAMLAVHASSIWAQPAEPRDYAYGGT